MTINDALQQNVVPDQTDWPSSYEDFQKIFWKFKGLRVEQQRKESFWSATNENLKKAYDQLEEQEREIEQAYGQIQRYLENIQEGLLLIDREYTIQDRYSVYLEELFVTRAVCGRNLIDFLYPNETTQEDERTELAGFLEILFSSKNASAQMINDVNPLVGKVITVGDAQTERRVIDATFTRILGDDGVESVMVIFVNRTHEVEMEQRLELEETRHESELETISAILKNGPDALLEFIGESNALVGSLKDQWSSLGDPELRTSLFKQVHSLKGTSKYFELNQISALAHEVEELISSFGTDEHTERGRFYRVIGQLESSLGGIQALNDKLRQFSESLGSGSRPAGAAQFFESLADMTNHIADELDKQVVVTTNNECGEIPIIHLLRKPIIHLVRNAIDHGIEDPYQRLATNKPMKGRVSIRAWQRGASYLVDVVDDGAGISFEGIRNRAVSLGLISDTARPDDRELVQMIFSPHFSSHDMSTEISGRGLGLDIVRDAVRTIGGRVAVATEPGRGTRFRIIIPAANR